jgi:hypothetical protein
MINPKVSIIIPWRSRNDIEVTLKTNSSWLKAHSAEVLIVNCGGSQEGLDQFTLAARSTAIREIHVPASAFNRPLALNVGIHQSKAPLIFVLARPMILTRRAMDTALNIVDQQTFVTIKQLFDHSRTPSSLSHCLLGFQKRGIVKSVVLTDKWRVSWSDGTTVECVADRDIPLSHCRAGLSCLLVHKYHLARIGGYNSYLRHGLEDIDVRIRLTRVLQLRHIEIGKATLLPNVSNPSRQPNCLEMDDSRVMQLLCLNYGKGYLKGTYSKDVGEM